ncbi:hypothetical protein ABVK35_10260 [Mycobacterium kansasii]
MKRPLTLADITPKEREHLELCVHEAGHAVAGVVLGGQLRSAAVTNSRVMGVRGLTKFAETPHGRDPEIAYAGPWAQARWSAGHRPSQRQMYALFDGGGRGDCDALSLAGGTYLGMSVTPLIERAWPAVIRVAQQLHRVGEVVQPDVLAALGVTDGGGPTSSQLAGLRSGCRSVPPLGAKASVSVSA